MTAGRRRPENHKILLFQPAMPAVLQTEEYKNTKKF
jgi:hypothetical protein